MMRSIGLGALAAMLFSLGWSPGRAKGPPLAHVSVTAHGVSLTLTIPRRQYPRNALVRVTVSVRNVSHVWMVVDLLVPYCRADGPSSTVRVLDPHGNVVFPAALPEPPLEGIPCLGRPATPQLGPGQVDSFQFFVILRSDRIRAVVTARKVTSRIGQEVKTSLLRLNLAPGSAPRVRVLTSPTVSADMHAQGGAKGKLYYTDWYTCVTKYGIRVAGQSFEEELPAESDGAIPLYNGLVMDWTGLSGSTLRPGCAQPLEWHVAAGWLNYPVATFSYVKQ